MSATTSGLAPHLLAASYSGPPELQNATYLTEWTLNPWVLTFIVIAGGLYLWGVRRHNARGGERWERKQTALFLSGLGVFALVTMSFLGAYERTLFWPRAAQNTLVLMVVPMLLALGAPLTLLLSNSSDRVRDRIMGALQTRPAQLLAFPGVVSVIYLSTPFLVYLTPWFEHALSNDFENELLRFTLLGVGYYYYWARLRVDPVPHEYPHLISVWITFAEAVTDGGLGIVIMWGSYTVAGSYYAALGRPWGLTGRQDQLIAGGVIWALGDLAGLPFIGALWRRMFNEDKDEAAAVDAVLDVLEAEQHAPRGPQDMEEVLPDGHLRPWWETDPVLSQRFGLAAPDSGE
jgi:cytochrome c oxidase assembly factor CtaG